MSCLDKVSLLIVIVLYTTYAYAPEHIHKHIFKRRRPIRFSHRIFLIDKADRLLLFDCDWSTLIRLYSYNS